jgi:hypothetical protein
MIQSPPAEAAKQRLSEALIGRLIGRAGIDLTLIDRLSSLGEGSTDRLTLESLSGDVAVLDWQSPERIVSALHAIGFAGQRAPHGSDPHASSVGSEARRIYAFDLSTFDDVALIEASLTQLLENRQVRTFSLGGISGSAAAMPTSPRDRMNANDSPALPDTAPVELRGPERSVATRHDTLAGAAAKTSGGEIAEGHESESPYSESPDSGGGAGRPSGEPGPASVDLDRLVDQLDQFDV